MAFLEAQNLHKTYRLNRNNVVRALRGIDISVEAGEMVGLEERSAHRPTELSGGQQQRVAIARALVTKPALLLADEPTGNLDSENTKEVMALLHRFNRELGQTIVLVTHDTRVSEVCSRVLTMSDGVITNVT